MSGEGLIRGIRIVPKALDRRRFEPVVLRRYIQNGKQVLKDGAHFADGINEPAAFDITEAMNRLG